MKYLLSLILSFALPVCADALVFKRQGEVVKSFSFETVKLGELSGEFGKILSTDETVFNIFRGYERTYTGYSFIGLLDVVYGQDWRKAKKISFIAADGYNQFAFVPQFLKAADGKSGVLAYGEKGRPAFSKFEKNGKEVDPGPMYLVWKNFSEKDKASHADTLKWPYQLATISID